MTARDIACRLCTAQPNEPCVYVGTRVKVEDMYHAERIADAGYLTENASPVDINEFDAAVENSGLV